VVATCVLVVLCSHVGGASMENDGGAGFRACWLEQGKRNRRGSIRNGRAGSRRWRQRADAAASILVRWIQDTPFPLRLAGAPPPHLPPPWLAGAGAGSRQPPCSVASALTAVVCSSSWPTDGPGGGGRSCFGSGDDGALQRSTTLPPHSPAPVVRGSGRWRGDPAGAKGGRELLGDGDGGISSSSSPSSSSSRHPAWREFVGGSNN
jgi:hypothetical protein